MVSAMEAFTNGPSAQPHSSSPFTAPDKLAELFIPQLESYLLLNTSVRFLVVTFPSSSLPAMLALRKLVNGSGSAEGLMKVAMVERGTRPSSANSANGNTTAPLLNKTFNEATVALNSRRRVPLAKLGAAKAASLLGNEEVPKPMSHKRQKTLAQRLSEEGGERLDFCLNTEMGGGSDTRDAIESDIYEFIRCIRRSLARTNSMYAALEPEATTIANWSAAITTHISHSPSSSMASERRRGKLRKLHPDSVGSTGTIEVMARMEVDQNSERQSDIGEWAHHQFLFLEGIGEKVPRLDRHPSQPAQRAPRRGQWDISSDDEDEAAESYICSRERGPLGKKRDLGKALRMLGIV